MMMIRSITCIIAGATAVSAFHPVVVPASSAVGTRNVKLFLSSQPVPFYANTDTVVSHSESTNTSNIDQDTSVVQASHEPSVAGKQLMSKKKSIAVKLKGPVHQQGVFSPVVSFVKGILGDERFNKVRAKAISLHSDVIGSFVGTSDSEFGSAVLASLFTLADADRSGYICEKELQTALHSLGFEWLKEKQIKGIFKRADTDGNGKIDIQEFMSEAPKTLRTNLVKLAKKNGGEMGLLV